MPSIEATWCKCAIRMNKIIQSQIHLCNRLFKRLVFKLRAGTRDLGIGMCMPSNSVYTMFYQVFLAAYTQCTMTHGPPKFVVTI